MKARTRLSLAVAATALLAGCATTGDGSHAMSQSVRSLNDAEYMAAVEQLATTRGVRVVWVNPPEKQVREED